ncbi:MAG TPA: DUF1080 domain-containing protein [Pirellulales bacterium]|jgi:hypothetical protein|nr:DUF1080 domain-containing protein [Pirellulales bacterium]
MPTIRKIIVCLAVPLLASATRADESPNTLADAEKTAGWKLLFDGKTLAGWHSFKKKTTMPEWSVEHGVMTLTPIQGKRNPGLVTDDAFKNFELSIEWKISPGGNSGVFYRVDESETGDELNWTGIECQVLDDSKYAAAKVISKYSSGAAYDMYPPRKDATKPVGQWNQLHIIVSGNRVEHWLNGEKIVDYDILSDDWLKRYEGSKFNSHPKYGRIAAGHIALQEHGSAVEYRNVKIREIAAK